MPADQASFEGVITAITTPMQDDGSIDLAPIPALVDFQVDGGISAVMVGGTAGEFAYQNTDERIAVLEAFIEASRDRLPVIMQAGALRTDDAVRMAKRAEDLGAAAVLLITPHYEALPMSDIRAYVSEVRGAAPSLPFMLYNSPSVTGVDIGNAELVSLRAELDIQYVKDARGNFSEYIRCLADPAAPQLVGGLDLHLLGAFAYGARTAITGASTFIPEIVVDLHRAAVMEADLPRAREVWTRLYPILNHILLNGYNGLMKAGCAMRGIPVGAPRKPGAPASAESTAQLAQLLRNAGIPLTVN